MSSHNTAVTNTSRLWGGGIEISVNEGLVRLNDSLSVDQRLWQEDLSGSLAYAEALCDVNILTLAELNEIQSGLCAVQKLWENGKINFVPTDEDVHTVNERVLTELIGPVGGKLHTGRSRNDQVALDVKMWMRKSLKNVIEKMLNCIESMVVVAKHNVDILMPGYTHLQRAQAVRFSHWVLSHSFFLKGDVQRFNNILEAINESMPLGSGALAGNPFNIDRFKLAERLDFTNVTSNSMHAVSDRDQIADFLYASSLTATHMSRLSEDIILYSTKEFDFLKISDSLSTGSSLMPQKRNPDSLELIRGTSGALIGKLVGFLATLKGTPSTYNKDLQFDKAEIFETYDRLLTCLQVLIGIFETLQINKQKMSGALSQDMLATDMAYYLVRKGVPFRQAHHVVSEVVELAKKLCCELCAVPFDDLKKINSNFDENVYQILNFETSVEQYNVVGGTSKASVVQQIKKLEQFVKTFSHSLEKPKTKT